MFLECSHQLHANLVMTSIIKLKVKSHKSCHSTAFFLHDLSEILSDIINNNKYDDEVFRYLFRDGPHQFFCKKNMKNANS